MTISRIGNGVLKALARAFSQFDALVVLDIHDAKVMDGIAYFVRRRLTLSSSSSVDIIVDPTAFTGTAVIFQPIVFDAIGGSLNVDIYRGATANDDGTLIQPVNGDLNIPAAGDVIFRQAPTGVVAGSDLIMQLFVPSNGTGVVASSGESGGNDLVTRLDHSKKYLIRITNNSGTETSYLGVKTDHFEVI